MQNVSQNFVTNWTVCNCPGDSLRVKATGLSSGLIALAYFSDAATDVFRTVGAGGDWNAIGTWEYQVGGAGPFIPAIFTPTSALAATVTILSGATVYVTANVTADQVTVNNGGTLNINSGVVLTLNRGASASDLLINGAVGLSGTLTQQVVSTGSYVQVGSTGVLTVLSGGLINGSGGNGATVSKLIVDGSGQWNINSGGSLNAGGGNGMEITVSSGGIATLDGPVTVGNSFTANGSVTASANITLTSISNLQIGGSLTMTAGTITVDRGNGGSVGTVNNGGVFTLSGSSVLAIPSAGTAHFDIASGGTLDIGPDAIVNGTGYLLVASGANLKIGSADGINATTSSGNVRTSSGTADSYSPGANYNYNGTAAQITGASLPATLTGNLTITNTAGVTPTAATSTINTPGSLIVNGLLTPTAAQVLAGTGTLTGTGTAQVTKTGNATNDFTAQYTITNKTLTNLTIEFKGAAAAQNSNTANYGGLKINNALGLTIGASTTVNGTLTLSSGNITTGANTLTSSGSISGGSSSSYVNGILARVYSGTGSKAFPVGKGASYRPMSFNYTALTGTSTVSAEHFTTGFPGTAPGGTALLDNRYWHVTQSGGSSFVYNITLDATGTSPSNPVVILKYDSPSTAQFSTTGSFPTYTASNPALNNLSDFALGQTTCIAPPNAGGNGTLTICAGSTPSESDLFNALSGTPDAIGSWSHTGLAYTYTVTATAPCTGEATATVTVSEQAQPNAGGNGSLTVCAGSTPSESDLFNALSGTPDAGGSWSHLGLAYTVTAIAPCAGEATATVTVSEQAQPNAGGNGTLTVCAGSTPSESDLFNALSGTPDAIGSWSHTGLAYTYTVTATAPCTGEATATVTVSEQAQPNAGGNGTLTVCAGSTPSESDLFNALSGTPDAIGSWSHSGLVYTYTVTATSPCTGEATATVTVSEQAQPNAGGNGSLTVCAGSTPSESDLFNALSGTPDAIGSWSHSGLVYTYTVTATAPCTGTATAIVTVSEQAQPNAGGNGTLTVCAGSTPGNAALFAALTGSPNVGGSWSHSGLVYTYTVTATAPCTGTATATVTVSEQAQPNAGGNGTLTICAGSTPSESNLFNKLTGSPNAGGSWSHSGLVYTYTVTATAPCTGTATATVTVSEQAQPNAGGNGTLTICSGSTPTNAALFAALTGLPTAGGSWSHVGLVYTYIIAATEPCSGNVTATVTVITTNCGCSLTVNAHNPNAVEDVYFGYSGDQTVTHTAAVSGGSAPYTYTWTMSRGLKCNTFDSNGDEAFTSGTYTANCSAYPSPLNLNLPSPPVSTGTTNTSVTVTLLDTAMIYVTVRDANGCIAKDSFLVRATDARCFAGKSGNAKVNVCHSAGNNKWVQLCVDESAVPAMLAQGDYVGKCTNRREEEELLSESVSSSLSAYPNPFNERTTVVFSVPNDGNTVVKVFDAIGKQVSVLFDGMAKSGTVYKVDFDGSVYPSGIYFYNITSSEMNVTKKMQLIK